MGSQAGAILLPSNGGALLAKAGTNRVEGLRA